VQNFEESASARNSAHDQQSDHDLREMARRN